MIERFINNLTETLDTQGFKLFFGTKTSYGKKRNIPDREVLLEPFQVSPYREGNCEHKTTLTMWIAVRRKIDDKLQGDEGRFAEFMDFMVLQATNILNKMNESEYIVILNPLDKIKMNYFESDQSQTNNTQSMLRFTIETIIYDKPE